jgi:hypothetical protein
LPADPEEHDQPGHRQHRHGDLQQAQPKDDAFHRIQLRQRELEADREHQENDTELGEILHARDVVRQVQRMRPDDAANQQVAEYRRQVETAEDHHGENRGAQQQQDERERAQVRFAKSGILRPS